MKVQVILLVLALLFTLPITEIEKAEDNGLNCIYWNSSFNLTENFTVLEGQKLVIADGIEINFTSDIFVTVLGQLECGGVANTTSMINTNKERLASGFVFENCKIARFTNTYFDSMALGIESVFSNIELIDCTLNNNGIGVLAYESQIDISKTTISNRCS